MAEKHHTMSKSPKDMEPDSLPTSQGISKVVEKGTSSLEGTLTEDGLSGRGGSRSGCRGRVGNMVAKWKRGRPRKNGGVSMTYVLSPSSPPPYLSQINWSTKRCRGRPRGSSKMWDWASLGGLPAETSGADFIPHVVTVHTGEDVVGRIFSFSERDSRAICILSANGVVSSVKLCQPCSIIGATTTYEGRFQILTLSGSLTFVERDGALVRNGTLSVTLANPDGRVFGGSVAGALTAASPIQLVLASFTQTDTKELSNGSSAEPVTAVGFPIDSALDVVPISFARPVRDNDPSLLPTPIR